jgi:AraC-like DNA-binding protein
MASLGPGAAPADVLPSLWRRSIAPFFDAQPVGGPKPADQVPSIRQYFLDKLIFADSAFSAQTFTRDRGWMHRHDETDHLLLQLFVTGENAVANGPSEYRESADNIYVVNCGFQIEAVSTDARVLSLILPRSLVMDELPHLADVRGALFASGSVGARLFIDHMRSLGANLPRATADEVPSIVKGTLGLLEALSEGGDAPSSQALDAAFRAACRYIDARLADPDLNVEGICAHLRCSRATLYRVFKPHGGVREHIQRRRLVECFKAICSPRHRHRRIFDIALDFGFVSPSHFSHLFREHFGMAPRDARDAGLEAAAGPPPGPAFGDSAEDMVARMWSWARTAARSA